MVCNSEKIIKKFKEVANKKYIEAVNQSADNVYVKSVTLNGVELEGTYVTHGELMEGGKLTFVMSNKAA